LNGKKHFGEAGVNGTKILRSILKETDSSSAGQGPPAGSCEHGNETSGPIKGWKFLNHLSDYKLLKEDSAPRTICLSASLGSTVSIYQ